MITNAAIDGRHTLDRLLGTVADAMHADVLVLDPDTQRTSPLTDWSGLACPARPWSAVMTMAGRSGSWPGTTSSGPWRHTPAGPEGRNSCQTDYHWADRPVRTDHVPSLLRRA